MPTADDIDSPITLELGDDALTSDELRRSVNAFDGLLKAMTRSVCRDDSSIEWFMRVKPGSLLLGADPGKTAGRQIVDEIKSAMDGSLDGNLPAIHADDVVKHIHTLAGIPGTRLWVGKKSRAITTDVYRVARAALRPGYTIRGSVEGRLSTLSEHSALAIYEPVWDRRIECVVPEGLLDGMRRLWRRRVVAHGLVHYRADGFPARIDADAVEPLPDDDELPTHGDVLGILRAE